MTRQLIGRRQFIAATAIGVTLPALLRGGPLSAQDLPLMQVTKSPSCGCCTAWIDLARSQGFRVEVTESDDYDGMKQAAGVPAALQSCHTARIGDYVVEGHVPFAAIRRMLADRPDITGLSVPEMPADSPGMGGGADAVVPVLAWGGSAGAASPYDF